MKNQSKNTISLKSVCSSKIEAMILSGEIKIGEQLPPERDLAIRFGVSRPVVHEALLDLVSKGLVEISPRHGVKVIDFVSTGSLALLDSLIVYKGGDWDNSLRGQLFAFRRLIEKETACLAASNRTDEQLLAFGNLLQQEREADCSDPVQLTEIDFQFHLLVAQSSGNLVYPLLLNSFKSAYTSYTRAFFSANICSAVIQQVFEFHEHLVQAIENKNVQNSGEIMLAMLKHGEESWKGA